MPTVYRPPVTPSGGRLSKSLHPPGESAPPDTPTGEQTWGGGQFLTVQMVRGVGVRGTVFALTVSSSDGSAWSLNRLTTHVRAKRTPSVIRTEA